MASGFFPSESAGNLDRTYPIETWADLFHAFHGKGVIPGYLDGMAVEAVPADPGTLRVRVRPGMALVDGWWYEPEGSGETVDFDSPDATTRVDALVVRADLSARTCGLAVRKGTSSSAPDIVNTVNTREIRLRNVEIRPSDTNVRQAGITGTAPEAVPWSSSLFARKASPDLSGAPTVGGKLLLHTGLMARTETRPFFAQGSDDPAFAPSALIGVVTCGSVEVPSWATTYTMTAVVSGLYNPTANDVQLHWWLHAPDMGSEASGQEGRVSYPGYFTVPAGSKRTSVHFEGSGAIRPQARGNSRQVTLRAAVVSGSGTVKEDELVWSGGSFTFKGA